MVIIRAKVKNMERIQTLASIDGKNSALKKQIIRSETDTNLLNPKRQVIRLFGTLLVSLGLIGFYYYQKSSCSPWPHDRAIHGTTLAAAFTLYLYCIFVLWQIFV